MKKTELVICCIFSVLSIEAQVEETDFQVELERWIENEEAAVDYQDLMDQTVDGKRSKINLNKAGFNEFSKLPFLTSGQILALLNHRFKYGNFISVFELQVVEGFDEVLVKKMIPFVEVKESFFEIFSPVSVFDKNIEHELVYTYGERLERAKGYLAQNDSTGPAFAGSPQRHVFRYRFRFKDKILAGFNGEKDAGEPFLSGNNQGGFDFNSFHLFYKSKKGVIRNIALGDFQAAFGQGLTFGSGLAFGKSPFVMNIKRTQHGLRPYRSLNENDFLRGAGVTLGNDKINTTFFAAINRLDGTVRLGDTLEDFYFSSFGTTGLHRTASEIEGKNSITRKMAGANVNYSGNAFSVGYTVINTHYDLPFVPSNTLQNTFRFRGNRLFNHGINYNYQKGNLLLFGEISSNGFTTGLSTVQGFLLSLGRNLDFAFLHRDIARDYQFTYSTAFSDNSGVSNEKGTYTGFVLKPSYAWTVSIYHDMYAFPWPRFRMDGPASGRDLLIEAHYTKRKRYTIYGRFRTRIRQLNQRENSPVNMMEETQRVQIRLHCHYDISDKLSIKTRAEWVQFQIQSNAKSKENGQMVFTDIIRHFSKINTRIVGRFMVFKTDGFDSRIYAFENDVLYSFTVPAFQNSGTRFFILTKTRINRKIDLWLRFARTNFADRNTIGSGQDRIDSNHLTDIKVQLRLRI